MTAATTHDQFDVHDHLDSDEAAGQGDSAGPVGLNVLRLWSYLCSVGALTSEPDIAALAREIPKTELLTMSTPEEWAVATLLNIPDTGWAWQLPAAREVLEEIAADEEVAGPLDQRLRTFPGRFGRILADGDSPYMDLAELVMEKLGERQQAAPPAANGGESTTNCA